MSVLLESDRELLERALDRSDLSDGAREAFEDMLATLRDTGRHLSAKQRTWAEAAAEGQRYEPVDDWEPAKGMNGGPVPRGREVPTPKVLQTLPKRPPGRSTP